MKNSLSDKKEKYYSDDSYIKLHEIGENSDRFDKAIEIIKRRTSGSDDKKILDIGCGLGNFTLRLKNFGNQLYAVEISEKAAKLAKEKGIKARLLDVDEQDLPYVNNFFDIIFCGELIEHVFDPDHLLDEIFRTLKPNGLAIITTPNLASYLNRSVMLFGFHPYFTSTGLRYNTGKFFGKDYPCPHLTVFTMRSLKELLLLHNFKVMEIKGANSSHVLASPFKIIDRLFTKIPSLATHLIFALTKD
jgi:2-polyprenyl-3-methyl-5-hydroxy-6-metoxy-1,4-benzoquinol methylase